MSIPSRPRRSVQEQYGRVAVDYRSSRTHGTPNGLVQISDVLTPLKRRFHVAVDVGTGAAAMVTADDTVRRAFGITPNADGTVDFFWPVLTLPAEKRA